MKKTLPMIRLTTGRTTYAIAEKNHDIPKIIKTRFADTMMVFVVISSEGNVMPPHIFEKELRVNTEVHLKVIKDVVVRCCNKEAHGRPWVCQ